MTKELFLSIFQDAMAYSNEKLPDSKLSAFIRSEQGGKEPSYPYAVYKITSNNLGDYRTWKEIENPDETKYSEEYYRKESINVSVTVVGKKIFDLYDISKKIYDYINIVSREVQQKNNFKLELLNSVQDRTLYLEPEYEYRVGFDFRIYSIGVLANTIDAIDIPETIKQIEIDIE